MKDGRYACVLPPIKELPELRKILERGLKIGTHTYTFSPCIDPASRGLITIHLFGCTPYSRDLDQAGKEELNDILSGLPVGPSGRFQGVGRVDSF